jgi:hypothetical protein
MFYHTESPLKNHFNGCKKFHVTCETCVSWCKLKLWYLNSCHKKEKNHVTCEIHVMMQVKTLPFKVSSQWKPPKTFVTSMGAKCLVLGTNATCYVRMDTHM